MNAGMNLFNQMVLSFWNLKLDSIRSTADGTTIY